MHAFQPAAQVPIVLPYKSAYAVTNREQPFPRQHASSFTKSRPC